MSKAMPPFAKRTEVRHDHGGQLIVHALLNGLKTVDIGSSPSFGCQPEGNGCVKRLIHTLAQQLWLHRFGKVAAHLPSLRDFKHHFNNRWTNGWVGYPASASHGRINLGHSA